MLLNKQMHWKAVRGVTEPPPTPQPDDSLFQEFSPLFVKMLVCWCKKYCLLILAIIGIFFPFHWFLFFIIELHAYVQSQLYEFKGHKQVRNSINGERICLCIIQAMFWQVVMKHAEILRKVFISKSLGIGINGYFRINLWPRPNQKLLTAKKFHFTQHIDGWSV